MDAKDGDRVLAQNLLSVRPEKIAMNDEQQDGQQGLYRNEYEHDACGVGLVADLNGAASHDIVTDGLTILKRLIHRGATGNDPETGDGAGILLRIPDEFFRAKFPDLPPCGQ